MDPITIALALAAQFAPEILKHFTNSDKAADVAGKVIEIAQTVTGAATPDGAKAAIEKDPAAALAFQQAVMAREVELERLATADLASARARDVAFLQTGKYNWMRLFLTGFTAVAIVGLVYYVIQNDDINEYAKGIISVGLGRLWGYLDGIYQFEFGRTRSGEQKDATIAAQAGAK